MKYCFIVNPAAGGGAARRNWPQLQAHLQVAGIDFCHYQSEYRGHCRELARAAFESGIRHFVAVGGDGTANEVLNGVLEAGEPGAADFSLGSVPWGTGNDWARYYGLSPAPESCVELLQAGLSRGQDIGKATFTDAGGNPRVHYFLNCAGTGFDSFLLDEMGAARGSRLRYLLYVIRCLAKYRPQSLRLDAGGATFSGRVLLLDVCLGRYAGAGMRFAPNALTDDGVFDVLLVDHISIPRLLGSLLYLYNGRIDQHRSVHSWQCDALSITAQSEQHFHCDGELVGDLPVEIEILPGALRVLTA